MKIRHAGRAAARAFVPVLLAAAFASTPAQAQFIPYFGKNKVKYDAFAWRVYKSPHFEIYYYPEFEQHLARVSSYAESAYQKVSSDLKHEMSRPIPLILYKTSSEFQQTNLFPEFVPDGVLGFTEPTRDRMVLPIDLPPDKLQTLITHELTHAFAFDLVPRTLVQRDLPLWVDEGLASYMEGVWAPLDLMMIRDAAVTEQVPKLSKTQFQPLSGRLVYNLGHAAFEYIEARYGKEGIRQFLYTLRKNIFGGNADDLYMQAFRIKAEEFDEGFEKWLKERFKAYRDKQRPSDYGRDISPDSDKTSYTQVFGFSPSPSGELVAALTANLKEGEADLVLLSAKDRSVLRNLTAGFKEEFENITFSEDFVAGRSIAFDPRGESVALFGRTGKRRSLFLISVLTGKIVKRVPLDLDQAQSPCLLPDGRQALFAASKDSVSDIYLIDLESGQYKNLTQDAFGDSNPQVSPDGTVVVYNRRVSGREKIYTFPLANPTQKTPMTFGAHDDQAPIFSPDGTKVYYASNEDDDIFNLRSLDLRTGVIRQYTDALGGNMAPAPVFVKGAVERLAFISYFKSEYQLHSIDLLEPQKEVDQEVRLASDEIVDFQPDVVHQVVSQNKRRKRVFEKLFLEGRPPLNVGITSGGDFFGGSQVALSDVLGDQNVFLTAVSVREFRSYDLTYVNLASRLHYGFNVFDNTSFFFSPYQVQQFSFGRQGVLATQRITGAALQGQYPIDKFRRLEFSAGAYHLTERYDDPEFAAFVQQQQLANGGRVVNGFNSGTLIPFGLNLVQETTRFREFGPLEGSTFALGVQYAPGVGSALSRTTLDADLRKYLRLGSTSVVFATRARGFKSFGDNPALLYFGGNMELRGFDYLSFVGTEGFFANAELRFPLIDVAKTPIGLVGPVRGTVFAGVGGARLRGQPFKFATSDPGISYINNEVVGEEVSGFHLVDGRASYGLGLQFFFLGYPLHFDWSKLTDFKVRSQNTRFDFWIGFDF